MKKTYQYRAGDKTIEREYNYIPVRYIVAVVISALEIAYVPLSEYLRRCCDFLILLKHFRSKTQKKAV